MTSKPPTPSDELVHVPHAPLTAYYQKEEDRSEFLREIFDKTAVDYDRIEKAMAFGSGSWYRHQALLRAGLAKGMKVADVGIGTGLVAREAASIIGDPTLITGIDPSAGMMNAGKLPAGITLLNGRAESIPLPDASVEFLSMGYALRHISDLSVAFTEFARVLKPGGRFCVLEITKPQTRLGTLALKTYMRTVVPIIAWVVAKEPATRTMWRYYWDTIEACAPPAGVVATLEGAGLVEVVRHVELGIFSEYQGRKAL